MDETAPNPTDEAAMAEFDKALAGYRAAREGTANGLAQAGVLCQIRDEQMVVAIQQQADAILTSQLESLPSWGDVACCAGCHFCCHQRIDVTPLEAIAIAGFLRQALNDMQLERMKSKLAENAERVRGLSKPDYARQRIRCALLDEKNCCGVYGARPFACVGWHSTSAERCQQIFESGDPGKEGIPTDIAARLQAQGFIDGARDATQRAGRACKTYELHSAVLCALNLDNAAEQFISADDPLEGCTPGVELAEFAIILTGADGTRWGLKYDDGTEYANFRLVDLGKHGKLDQ